MPLIFRNMNDSSPKWKRPSDVMKLIRKKKKVIVKRHVPVDTNNQSNSRNLKRESGKDPKRKNPFSCSPQKRAKRQLGQGDSAENGTVGSCELFDILDEKKTAVNMLNLTSNI